MEHPTTASRPRRSEREGLLALGQLTSGCSSCRLHGRQCRSFGPRGHTSGSALPWWRTVSLREAALGPALQRAARARAAGGTGSAPAA
eukprot:5126927-Pyramimonas_sp.AAC.1